MPDNLDMVNKSIEKVIQDFAVSSSSDEEENSADDGQITWTTVTGLKLKKFTFTEPNPGVNLLLYENYFDKSPLEFYQLFLDEDILTMMVTETNRYGAQCQKKETAPKARIHNWQDTNVEELQRFIGLLLWMGLVQYPSIESYWSKMNIYSNAIKSVMSRNRFQLLLKTWHFNNNENVTTDRLQKISPLTNKLIENFKRHFIPNQALCIDETLVPFRGRLSFRQYIKNKRHKFGIKVYKLCIEKGYTYNLLIYCGQDRIKGESSSQRVVLTLADGLLNKGRTIYTDNYYTSITLAHALLGKNTHLVGTLRSNRKLNPQQVVSKKLKKGETEASESSTGVVVQKWKDKRDVLTLSTKHTDELLNIRSGHRDLTKPAMVVDYNKHKAYIDLSDQMKSYTTSLRRGVKWYRKLAIELLLGSALVNAHILHQEVANEKMSITKFKEQIASKLLGFEDVQQMQNVTVTGPQHSLEENNSRGRCFICYKKLQTMFGRTHAQSRTPRTKLKCTACEKYYCLECFFQVHNCTK